MDLWANFGFAWLSVILALLLSIIYITGKAVKKRERCRQALRAANSKMRKYHKHIGILLIATGLIHGLFSSSSVLDLNIGTFSWISSILMGLNWLMRKNFSLSGGWLHYHRILTVLFLSAILWHIVDVGGIQAHKVFFSSEGSSAYVSARSKGMDPADLNKQFQGAKLKDGIFTGEAVGYMPGLRVSVEVRNNSIVNIQITEHNEVNRRFYDLPMSIIPQLIMESQSTNVDIISGATFTSIGIKNAVNNALSKALISGSLPKNSKLPKGIFRGF